MLQNVKSVLGPNPLLWLWPQDMRGDGVSFPVNPDAGGESASHLWAGAVAPSDESRGTGSLSNGHVNGEERLRHGRKDDHGDVV